MQEKSSRPVILAAGGTGGHLYPALAVYRALIARGIRARLLTDDRGMRFVDGFDPAHIDVVPSGGLVSGSPLKRLGGLVKLFQGWSASRRLIKQHRAAGIVGLGGYGSVPPIIAASQLGLNSLLYQGDAVLGRANAFVAGRVKHLCLSFPDTAAVPESAKDKIVIVGAPMRDEIEALHNQPYAGPGEKVRILCVGGSLGAQVFASILPRALGNLSPEQRDRLHMVQQVTNPEDKARVQREFDELELSFELLDYIHDMPQRLVDCDLVIARSGGTTVHEIAAVGRTAIFIPLGIHKDAQQKHNARYLQSAGCAWIVEQNDTAASGLAEILRSILDKPAQLAHKAEAAKSMAILGAANNIADLAEQEFDWT